MRNINEVLHELENIINSNLDVVHRLTDYANTYAKDNQTEQAALARAVASIWDYLKPVHRMIREQNPAQTKLYDKIDEYIVQQDKHPVEAKSVEDISILEPLAPKTIKKGKK